MRSGEGGGGVGGNHLDQSELWHQDMIKLLTSLNRITCDLVVAGGWGVGCGAEFMVLFSKLLEIENSCWTIFFFSLLLKFSFFVVDKKKRQEDEDDVMEGVGLVSLAIAGWLVGSMKNEE